MHWTLVDASEENLNELLITYLIKLHRIRGVDEFYA